MSARGANAGYGRDGGSYSGGRSSGGRDGHDGRSSRRGFPSNRSTSSSNVDRRFSNSDRRHSTKQDTDYGADGTLYGSSCGDTKDINPSSLGRIAPASGGGGGGNSGRSSSSAARASPSRAVDHDNKGLSSIQSSDQHRRSTHSGDSTIKESAGGSNGSEMPRRRFTNRCRLFVGNLPTDCKESEIRDLMKPYGEISECFVSGKGFSFVRLETRSKAEAAKEGLDGHLVRGRPIRVRFAVHGAAIRLKELSPFASNELLHQAFSQFGDIERAVHIVDEKGHPTGEGFIEFARKPSAMDALRACKDEVLLLTGLKPVLAEALEPKDEEDGLSERMISRSAAMAKEREVPPRIAAKGSFEESYGQRWKELYAMEKIKRQQLEAELKEQREKLEGDMELAHQEYQAQLMREELKRRQEDLERLEQAHRERQEALKRREQERHMSRPEPTQPFGGQQFAGGPPLWSASSGQRDFNNATSMNPLMAMGGIGQFGGAAPPLGNSGPLAPGQNPPGRGRDEGLVQGVHKLLQMFKGGSSVGDGGAGLRSATGPHASMQSPPQPPSSLMDPFLSPGMMSGAPPMMYGQTPGADRRQMHADPMMGPSGDRKRPRWQ